VERDRCAEREREERAALRASAHENRPDGSVRGRRVRCGVACVCVSVCLCAVSGRVAPRCRSGGACAWRPLVGRAMARRACRV
jgi:hypothetical protein